MAAAAAVATVVSILGSAYYTHESIQEQRKATKKADALANEQARLDKEAQEMELAETRRQNRNLLAEQQAAYKAKLGASGLSVRTGSGQTVLDKMQRDYDMEDKYLVNRAKYSLNTLNNSLAQTNNRNLLSLNQQSINQKENVLNTINNAVSTGAKYSNKKIA